MINSDTETSSHKVVISGISGRFPNADNVSELKEKLLNKVDCTAEKHGRWDIDNPKVPQRIGKCNNIQKFDRVFFGLHAKLTNSTDPLSRVLLEHSFEAILDAGINPRSLKGKNVAVFVATSGTESLKAFFCPKIKVDGFGIMGSSKAMTANRISFFLGLTGPSVHVDSGCTGSATALQLAYHEIKTGRCESAIVAGAMLNLYPHLSHQMNALGEYFYCVLSADGQTRSFDNAANGYARSDSIAVLFLQRDTDANRIYMEVLNARTTHADGPDKPCMMYPSAESQITLMKQMLNECKLLPDDISFLEASGVAIKTVDANELEAINQVYGDRKKPLPIGAVKSNLGNAVAVNTINSIIKVIIASESGKVPPTINHQKLNSKAIFSKECKLYIPMEVFPWTGKYSSINTTSYCGVFANILLKVPDLKNNHQVDKSDNLPRLVTVSGRTEEAVSTILDYVQNNSANHDFIQLIYNIFESNVNNHLFRGYTVTSDKNTSSSKKHKTMFDSGKKRDVWWIFSGMGSQWVTMGKELLKLSVFEKAIKKCDAVLKPKGYDIFKIITDNDPEMFSNVIHSFIGIAAIQVGLVDVLKSVGLNPDYLIGHSVGELGCAYADGCFTAEQMVLAALSRGLASVETELIYGSMAAVGLGYEDVAPLCPSDIDVACHNSAISATISGPAESMKKFVGDLKGKSIFAKEVPCSNIAYHSRYIANAAPKLLEYLKQVIPDPKVRSSKWLSTSVPMDQWATDSARFCSAEYHTNNLLNPVLFEEILRKIPENAICVEISPHGLLQPILKKSLLDSCINIALTKRFHPHNLEHLFEALGEMYNAGLQPKISQLYPRAQFPVRRGTPSISSLIRWDHSEDRFLHKYEHIIEITESERTYEININEEENEYLQGYVINGKFFIPMALYLTKAWEIWKSFKTNNFSSVIFEDIKIYKQLINVPENHIVNFSVTVFKGTSKFEVTESEIIIASGVIKGTKSPDIERIISYQLGIDKQCEFNQEDFYMEMQIRGYQYSGKFRNVLRASIDGSLGVVKWEDNWTTFIDGALQLYAFGNYTRNVEAPILIRKIVFDFNKHETMMTKSKEVWIVIDRSIACLSTGGLEIQGLQLEALPKSLEHKVLTSDIMKIIPNFCKFNSSAACSLRSILQLVLENTFSTKMPKLNFAVNRDSINIGGLREIIMNDIPESELFEVDVISYKASEFNATLTILLEDFRNYNPEEIMKKLGKLDFMATFISEDKAIACIDSAESVGLEPVLTRKSEDRSFILFRRKQNLGPIKFLYISKNNIETILNSLKCMKFSSSIERLLIIIKLQDVTNLTELVTLIKRQISLNCVRIYCIEDIFSFEDKCKNNSFYKKQIELDLFTNILTTENVWATLRPTAVVQKLRMVNNWTANRCNNVITWTEGPIIKNNDSVIRVEYSTLNYEDTLIANEKFYASTYETEGTTRMLETRLGIEFAGTDSKGNRVMGITYGNSMSSSVIADPAFTWTIPDYWSFEEAVTIPFSYIIAYAVLKMKADVKKGEKIFIDNPCNGFGLAIIHLALQQSCEIFLTYKTQSEKELLQSTYPKISPDHFFNSSINNLRDDIFSKTKGLGMDVVICNTSSVNMLRVLLTLISRTQSRVIMISDLSDNEIHEHIGMHAFLSSVKFSTIVPKRLIFSSLNIKIALATMLRQGICAGFVQPLKKNSYDRSSLTDAYNICLKGNYIGKIIVKVQPEKSDQNLALAMPRFYCMEEKTYLIIEGLTPFGLELIGWLIARGARQLIITSTFNRQISYVKRRLNCWRENGVQIIVRDELSLSQRNIKNLLEVALTLGPVDAIFDLQRIQSSLKFNEIDFATKILDEESRRICCELRLFLVCSVDIGTEMSISINKLENACNTKTLHNSVEELLKKRRIDSLHGLHVKFQCLSTQKDCSDLSVKCINLCLIKNCLKKFDDILGVEDIVVETKRILPYLDMVTANHSQTAPDTKQEESAIFAKILYQKPSTWIDGISLL
ncbi:hypothetical protein TSAR_011485 [Trichomalopsis sarcophagae]|uniref:Uncharacterized protein n=1 Tax=Trichomalopsis sarcophagae TaxID=543379 RepID=A0A232F0Y4_9HYME|nr:hypothetical protein TSAR_011485 [Trichomalopsis sarcophagae]